jgi:hypothetical protein
MSERFFRTSIGSGIRYHSIADVAYTDPTSNAVVIDNFDPLAYIDKIREGRMPLDLLPNVLHECTHHVTFDSSVGLALAALWSGAVSTWTFQAGTENPTLPARDLAVIRVHRALYTPLVEGLALFAEHDLVSGDSPLETRMTKHVVPLFSSSNELLRHARQEPDWIERKRLLLSQPVDPQQHYLLGYLAVKALHRRMSRDCPPLRDPELFVLAVMRHLFHDESTAAALLHMPSSTDDALAAYVNVGMDVSAITDRFQDACSELLMKPNAIGRETAVALLQRSGASPLSPELQFLAGLRTAPIQLQVFWPKLFRYRMDFRFGVRHADIHVDEDGVIRLDGNVLDGVRAVPNSIRGSVAGSVEAVRLHDLTTTVICIAAHDGLIAVLNCGTGRWNEAELVEQLEDFPSSVAIEGAMHEFVSKQELVLSHPDIAAMIEGYERQADEAVQLVYPQLLLDRRPHEERNAMLDGLNMRGVTGAISESDQREVAAVSLAIGTGKKADDVAALLGVSVDALKNKIRRLNVTTPDLGFPLFEWLDDGTLFSNV